MEYKGCSRTTNRNERESSNRNKSDGKSWVCCESEMRDGDYITFTAKRSVLEVSERDRRPDKRGCVRETGNRRL